MSTFPMDEIRMSIRFDEIVETLGDMCELRAMWFETLPCVTSTLEVTFNGGMVPEELTAIDPQLYLHSARLLRRAGLVAEQAWKPATSLSPFVALDDGFRTETFEDDRLVLEIEYAGGGLFATADVRLTGTRSHNRSQPCVIERRRNTRRAARHGASLAIVVDDRVICVSERRPGELQTVWMEKMKSLEREAHVLDVFPNTIGAKDLFWRGRGQRLPRPIAVRRFRPLQTVTRTFDGDVGMQTVNPGVDLVTGYDDERGWVFAFGRGPAGAIVEMNASGYTPTWM